MQILESTEKKTTKDKNDGNVPHLKITEVIVVHYSVINNIFQQHSTFFCTFVPNKPFVQLLKTSSKCFIFSKTFKFGLMVLSLVYWSKL